MSLLRHGKVDNGDVSGIVGLVDNPANVTNGVVLKWPSFADGLQQLTLQLIGGGTTTEISTRKWVGVESVGDLSDGHEASQAKQNYGIRIIPDENRILVMDGGAVIEQVIAENVDLTQALKPAIIMQSNDSTARATEFEAITVNSYSNEQIAPATVFSDVVSTLAITGSYETDLYDNSGALAYSGEITYDSGAAFISGLDTGLNAEIFGTVFVDGVNIAVKSVSDIDDYSSSITATLEEMPAGTYNIRVTNVDENTTVYSAQKTLISETFTIDFSNVQKGTNCEVFVLTPDDLPAGAARGVTE